MCFEKYKKNISAKLEKNWRRERVMPLFQVIGYPACNLKIKHPKQSEPRQPYDRVIWSKNSLYMLNMCKYNTHTGYNT